MDRHYVQIETNFPVGERKNPPACVDARCAARRKIAALALIVPAKSRLGLA